MSPCGRRAFRAMPGVALLAAATVLLAACSSSGGPAPTAPTPTPTAPSGSTAATLPKTLVFSPIGLQVPAMKVLSERVSGYFGAQGWKVIVQDPSLDPQKQVQQVQEVLESGVAGALWIIAIAPASMTDVVKAAQSKGVPVLINGVPEDYGMTGPQPGISFETIDYEAGGTALGEQLGTCINEKLGGNARVIYGESAAGTAGKKESDDSFLAALKATAPNATVVQNWTISDRVASQTDVGNILQGEPDVNAVAAANDEGALGAFKAAGKELPCLVEFGGNDEILALVKTGTIYASVALRFAAGLAQSVDTLGTMQGDPTAVGPILTVPQKVITKNG